jgi:hypothetical protein
MVTVTNKSQDQQKKTEKRIDTLDTTKLINAQEIEDTSNVTADVTMETNEDDEFEKEVKKIESNENTDLFKGMKIFLSREVTTKFP